MVTEQIIRDKLSTDQHWLERAVIAIHNLQTSDEQQAGTTRHDNGVGFNSADADILSYCARWLNRGNHLTGKWLNEARRRMPKYAKQLLAIAATRVAA